MSIIASDELVTAIFNALREQHPPSGKPGGGKQEAPHQVSFTSFVQNISSILKGSLEQKSQFFLSMVNTSIRNLEKTLLDIFECVLQSPKSLTHLPEIHHWPANSSSLKSLVSFLTQSLKLSTEAESDAHVLTRSELEGWLASSSIPLHLLQIVVSLAFLSHHLSDIRVYMGSEECPDQLLIPAKIVHPLLKEKFSSTLLDHATATLINSAIPFEHRGVWYPLFSSRHHGESFSTLCKQIFERGPTVLVLKDEDGHIFGGFAEDDWKCHPQFRGE